MFPWRKPTLVLVAAGLLCPAMLAQKTTKPPIQVQAWDLLHAGVKDENTEKRTTAVRVLSLLPGDKEAVKLAEKALQDKKPEVRAAAAMALGEVHSTSSMPKLRQALSDKEVPVVVAAAHSLLLLKDKSAYDIYYAILTGQRRSSHGLIEEQMATLKDRRQMAEFGFEQAIGYVPFAGMGYDAIRALRKEDASPVRAAAARVLADDTDPSTGQALLETAVGDKEWVIRAAALDAIARRGDPALLEKLWPTLTDDKDPVRYTAAAAVLRLTAIAKNKVKNK